MLAVIPVAGFAVAAGTAGVCAFDGDAGVALAAVFGGQGFAVVVPPITSEADDGRSHRFLFWAQASFFVLVSSQPGFRWGAGVGLAHGAVDAAADCDGVEGDGLCWA